VEFRKGGKNTATVGEMQQGYAQKQQKRKGGNEEAAIKRCTLEKGLVGVARLKQCKA